MRQQGIAAVQDTGDGVHLMGPEGDFRIHAHEPDMAAVVFPGTYAVESGIVERGQPVAPLRVFPYPVAKSVLDKLLLLLREDGFLFVQYPRFVSVVVNNRIEDTHILEVERFFYNFIGIDAICAVGNACRHVAAIRTLALDVPCRRDGRIMHLDAIAKIVRCA